jgi:hypothetical protein
MIENPARRASAVGLPPALSGLAAPALAQDAAAPASSIPTAASGWNFTAELYGWMPSLNPELTSCQELEIDFGDILDSPQFTLSGHRWRRERPDLL